MPSGSRLISTRSARIQSDLVFPYLAYWQLGPALPGFRQRLCLAY
jgi:hypothetical protein